MLGDFNENETFVAPGQAANGPYVDQLEGFNRAWEAQTRASAQMGMVQAIGERDAEQARWLRDQGEIDIPLISPDFAEQYFERGMERPFMRSGNYKDMYRFYGKGGDEKTAQFLAEYDAKIEAIKKKYPQRKFLNSREMFDTVVQEGVKAEQDLENSRGGGVGKFFGSAFGSLAPSTDPLNFATLGVGGAGKTAAMRIASQMGAQGVIEGINQITGVQEQREIMGLSHGFADAASRVGGAVVGGGVAQGVGEAVGAGVRYAGRRWFNSTPNDPAPLYEPPSYPQRTPEQQAQARQQFQRQVAELHPLTRTPEGRARAAQDLDYVKTRMEAWDGEKPLQIAPPRTDTAIPPRVDDFVPQGIREGVYKNESVDVRARQIDPKTFKEFDTLSDQKVLLRQELERMRPDAVELQKRVDDISDQIDGVRNKLARNVSNNSKRAPATAKRLEALEAERAELLDQIKGKDTPQMAAVRDQLMKVDYRTRDLAPQVGRAYAQARGDWELREEYLGMMQDMVRTGNKTLSLPDNELAKVDVNTVRFYDDMVEAAPILQRANTVEGRMREDADALDYAAAIMADDAIVKDESIEAFRTSIKQALESEDGTVSVLGYESKLNLADEITVPNPNGKGERTITVRQLLEEQLEAEENVKAITSCSI
jgi:hypothetical protein